LVIGNLIAGQAHAEDITAQPLTRSDCDKAAMSWDDSAKVCGPRGMAWNDNANVCGKKSEAPVAPKATNPAAPTVVINIDKNKQRMTVLLDGVQRYHWPVSTGKAGYSTPSGNFTPIP
jgi:hypothetical protein